MTKNRGRPKKNNNINSNVKNHRTRSKKPILSNHCVKKQNKRSNYKNSGKTRIYEKSNKICTLCYRKVKSKSNIQ